MVMQQTISSAILCAKIRNHIRARPSVNGWVVMDDRNFTGNTVYLVSRYRDFGIAFHHEEPYHDHLRACHQAGAYAEMHVESAPAPTSELVVKPLIAPSA